MLYDSGNGSSENGNIEDTDNGNGGQDEWFRLGFSIFCAAKSIFLGNFTRFPNFEPVIILLYDSGNGSSESGNVEDTDYENGGQDLSFRLGFFGDFLCF